ncbi:hypothetical protein QEV83_05310 [Methylocapsa sp. D3K7]|uniref:hypothetical protein n=1 Tax=Methylocapsa sp. D3K7 TaxID=3041435 RepID=UPI00244ECC96|nr:hypothetical protein [Methylocapsa sp. D3K7]WGJ15681.1 hypothetical protein QEV83_05310 [Methylocapsa sp. D3K7]
MAVTSAAAYVSSSWVSRNTDSKAPIKWEGNLERRKTIPLNVPMISNGVLEGYIVAQFIYLADARNLNELAMPPDDFITDEAFRLLYSSKVDFAHLEKYDLQNLTTSLAQKINLRFGKEIIKEVLVEEFTYVPKQDISR